jgi:hypothetical protein
MDKDKNGFLTVQEVRDALLYSKDLDDGAIQEIIDDVDKNGDGKISFSEFAEMITGEPIEDANGVGEGLAGLRRKENEHPRVPTPKHNGPSRGKVLKASELKKDMPPLYKVRRFYLPDEVAAHNQSDDCWVSAFNYVYDLTKLIQENFHSELCDPIILNAGTDITHWFDPLTR